MKILRNLILINIISLIFFIFIIIELLSNGFLVRVDLLINSIIPQIENSFLTNFSNIIGILFGTISMIIISLILVIYLWFRYSKWKSIFFGITMLLSGLVFYIIKEIVQRARPLNSLVIKTDFAFPSGHVTSSIVFFGLITYLILNKSKSKNLKLAIILISIFMVLLICFTRLYLNVHWFTDVLAGLVLGTFILTICMIIKEFLEIKYSL